MHTEVKNVDRRSIKVDERIAASHPQGVVDGVLLLVLGHHQSEGVAAGRGQLDLGQIVGAVDADTVDVGRGVRCGGHNRDRTSLLFREPGGGVDGGGGGRDVHAGFYEQHTCVCSHRAQR